jgi:hypothetical protein
MVRGLPFADFDKWERVTTLGLAERDGAVRSFPFADFNKWGQETLLDFAKDDAPRSPSLTRGFALCKLRTPQISHAMREERASQLPN